MLFTNKQILNGPLRTTERIAYMLISIYVRGVARDILRHILKDFFIYVTAFAKAKKHILI